MMDPSPSRLNDEPRLRIRAWFEQFSALAKLGCDSSDETRNKSSGAILLLLLLPVLAIAYVTASFHVVLAPGKFYAALLTSPEETGEKTFELDGLLKALSFFVQWSVIVSAIQVGLATVRDHAANRWRLTIACRLHQAYFPPDVPVFYATALENPDQRMTEDVTKLTSSFFRFLSGDDSRDGVLVSLVSLVWYTFQTWKRVGLLGVGLAYFSSTLASVVTIRLLARVSPAIYTQEKLEGNLRYSHGRMRSCSEEIALWGTGQCEAEAVHQYLLEAVRNQSRVILRKIPLRSFERMFSYLVTIGMYAVLGFYSVGFSPTTEASGSSSSGQKAEWISQTAGVFLSLLYAFSSLIQLGDELSNMVAFTARVAECLVNFDSTRSQLIVKEARLTNSNINTACTPQDGDERDVLVLDGVELQLGLDSEQNSLSSYPTGGYQLPHLTLGQRVLVSPGKSLLVTGPSGSGKTSLMRAIRGLRQYQAGYILRPRLYQPALQHFVAKDALNRVGVLFLPQRSYLLEGCVILLDQILYPGSQSMIRNQQDDLLVREQILEIMHRLSFPVTDLNERCFWEHRLSSGEQQLVGIARIAFHRPRFVVMDEPASHLDDESRAKAYRLLDDLGITMIEFSPTQHLSLQAGTLHNVRIIESGLERQFLVETDLNGE